MRNSSSFYNLFIHGRKTLYIVLSIVMVSVLTLTVVYAALSTTLNIDGNAEVSAASWDIYLDNVELNSGSATSNAPIIIDKTTASFSTTLSKPGDYYMFTIDVVNNGSIDAMINSITKTPELTDTQKKYLNYIVEYQNGESITTKQLVEKNSFVRLKVKVELRNDITASDLSTTSEILNLSFKVNYVQSDDSGENTTIDNSGKLIKVVSGDLETVGSEICVDTECFYVISRDEDSITMFAKYNLYVGGDFNGVDWIPYGDEATGLQNEFYLGWGNGNSDVGKGTITFSDDMYWQSTFDPIYTYNYNSNLYIHVENYKDHLINLGIDVLDSRIISVEELILLGCDATKNVWTCVNSPYLWTYSTAYWTGSTSGSSAWRVDLNGSFGMSVCNYFGVRPVITIAI